MGINTVLVLGVPPNALMGIDLQSFSIPASPPFHGIDNIPAGFHFLFVGSHSTLSSRQGIWLKVPPPTHPLATNSTDTRPVSDHPLWRVYGGPLGDDNRICALKWDAGTEALVPAAETDVKEWALSAPSGSWRSGIANFEQIVNPRVEEIKSGEMPSGVLGWRDLTRNISAPLLDRIFPAQADKPVRWCLTTGSSTKMDVEDIPAVNSDLNPPNTGPSKPQNSADSGSDTSQIADLNLLPIDLKNTWREGAIGTERTSAARDRSWALNDISVRFGSSQRLASGSGIDYSDITGELQFCFLAVLSLNNFSCLSQWRRLLELVLTSTSAVSKTPSLAVSVLRTLRFQLGVSDQMAPDSTEDGLFDLSESGASFLKSLLVTFRARLEEGTLSSTPTQRGMSQSQSKTETQGNKPVLAELRQLERYLGDKHGWQLGTSSAFVRTGKIVLEDGEEVDIDNTERDEFDDMGEYAPVIVDLTEEQSKMLNFDQMGLTRPEKRLETAVEETELESQADDDESSHSKPRGYV